MAETKDGLLKRERRILENKRDRKEGDEKEKRKVTKERKNNAERSGGTER